MRIPRYWARRRQLVKDGEDNPLDLMIVAGSMDSPEDAETAAQRRLDAIVKRLRGGGELDGQYSYGIGEMREEIKDELLDEASGQTRAVITRNIYGALVLNAATTMFVDIDLPFEKRGLWTAIKAHCFGILPRGRGSVKESALLCAMDRVDLFCRNHPEWGFRVYRTYAGLRLLATHDLFDPKSDQTLQWMRELDCDPLYLKLCRAQDSFRARLTPKPWRCDMELPPVRFPWVDAKAETRFRNWEAHYERRVADFRTCELVGTFGTAEVHPEVQRIIEIHDAYACQPETAALA